MRERGNLSPLSSALAVSHSLSPRVSLSPSLSLSLSRSLIRGDSDRHGYEQKRLESVVEWVFAKDGPGGPFGKTSTGGTVTVTAFERLRTRSATKMGDFSDRRIQSTVIQNFGHNNDQD